MSLAMTFCLAHHDRIVSGAATQEEAPMPIKRILVPIDFSKDSLDALGYATQFAASFGAAISSRKRSNSL
jgi:hypothetical protein